jgi:hypothetical protein
MAGRHHWNTSHWRGVAEIALELLLAGFDDRPDAEVGHLDKRLRRIMLTAREADERGLGPDVILHEDLVGELALLENLPAAQLLRCVHKCE